MRLRVGSVSLAQLGSWRTSLLLVGGGGSRSSLQRVQV